MEQGDITAILTVWKRNHIEEQIHCLLNQTLKPKEIWLYQNQQYVDLHPYLQKFAEQNIKYIYSDIDFKYFGRFTLPILIKTEYTVIIDDDVVFGKKWLEICLQTLKLYNAIIGPIGRIIPKNNLNFEAQSKTDSLIGDCNLQKTKTSYSLKDTFVDWICHSWFFKTDWIYYFWAIKPITFENGEDIHFSAACKVIENISSVVPIQNDFESSGDIKPRYGWDRHASFLHKKDFFEQRKEILEYWIHKKKWKPINW